MWHLHPANLVGKDQHGMSKVGKGCHFVCRMRPGCGILSILIGRDVVVRPLFRSDGGHGEEV